MFLILHADLGSLAENVFRDQVTKDEWLMIRKMKDEQGIQ
jgi:hypothetical protein